MQKSLEVKSNELELQLHFIRIQNSNFDEPTSSLDLETENSIIDNIVKLKGDKTIILISHKMSIIERCDKIIKL